VVTSSSVLPFFLVLCTRDVCTGVDVDIEVVVAVLYSLLFRI
jgi:hypothetical protein